MSAKGSPSSSPTARFFSIPELLELTLLHIPPHQLLLIQRTSAQFHDIIRFSPLLQQILFFKPLPPTNNNGIVQWNPFAHKLTSKFETGRLQHMHWKGCGKLLKTDMRNAYPNASWKRMFVCQPPKKEMEMVMYTKGSTRYLGILEQVEAGEGEDGCRMSDVYEHGWHDLEILERSSILEFFDRLVGGMYPDQEEPMIQERRLTPDIIEPQLKRSVIHPDVAENLTKLAK